MTLGGDGVDIGSGITVLLDTEEVPKEMEIMGKTYALEVDAVSYKYLPQDSNDDTLYLDRYSLELTWVSPKRYEAGAMIFSGSCEILDEEPAL